MQSNFYPSVGFFSLFLSLLCLFFISFHTRTLFAIGICCVWHRTIVWFSTILSLLVSAFILAYRSAYAVYCMVFLLLPLFWLFMCSFQHVSLSLSLFMFEASHTRSVWIMWYFFSSNHNMCVCMKFIIPRECASSAECTMRW